jgi:hypothetical protein
VAIGRAVDVVLLAYGEEPWLEPAVDAVLASTGVDVRLLLVDNGAGAAVDRLPPDPRVTVLR